VSALELNTLPTSYTWAFPGSATQVLVRLSVVHELQRLLRAPASSHDVGTVRCGLLLGDTSRPGCTEITGFQPISTLNPAALEAAGRQLKRNVVGFYRTTRKNFLRMNPADLSLTGSHFSQPGFVVMLIEVDRRGPCNAVFLSSDQGQMNGDLAGMVFPFDAYQLAIRDQVRGQASPRPIARAETALTKSHFSVSRGVRRVFGIVVGAILAAGAITGYFYFRGGAYRSLVPDVSVPDTSASAEAPLSLSIEKRGPEVLLSWDRHSPAVHGADFGMLSIREGDSGRNIRLSAEQLQQGSVLYMARTDRVEMELNLISGEKVARASTTVLLDSGGAVQPVSTPAQTLEAAGRRLAGLASFSPPRERGGASRLAPTPAMADPVRDIASLNLRPTPPPAETMDAPRSSRLIGAGENSRARALPVKISRVVIDPGHGGSDEGIRGVGGLLEKDVALDVARRLGELVEQRMGAEVIYTRTADIFVPLEGRIALANEKKADLFLSIHANSSPSDPHMRGSDVYYLNFTRSKEALEVAARENAGSERSVFELRELIQKITVQNKGEESRDIAERIQAALYPLSARNAFEGQNRGAQKAPLTVLIDAHMPSVVAELGYLSNRDESTLLHDAEYRQKLAEGLFRGISGAGLARVSQSEPPRSPARSD